MSTTADHSPLHDHDSTGEVIDGTVATDCILTEQGAPTPVSTSSADRFMRKLLRLPEGRTSTAAEARSAFQKSLLISTCRCLLMYIVFPFVLPAIGVAKGVGPYIGLAIGLLAMVSIVYSIRRFWRANHSKRWHYTVFGGSILVLLVVLAVRDLASIFG